METQFVPRGCRHELVNPGPAETRNIEATLTNLLFVAWKYPDALADLMMTILLSYSIGPPQSL